MKGIDVSKYQGNIDWHAVADANIDFAIIKGGYGRDAGQIDPKFERNYAGARQYGIGVSAYWYSYADSVARAHQEATACIKALEDKKFGCVWFDQEYEPGILALTNAQRTEIVKAFISDLEAAGYYSGLYCSADWWISRVDNAKLGRGGYDINLWIADYRSTLSIPHTDLWQYSSNGTIAGISGRVDVDVTTDYTLRESTMTGAVKPTGNDFVYEVQQYTGAKIDGIPGPDTLRHTVTVSEAINRKHAVVKVLQRHFNSIGIDMGAEDGIAGPKFIAGAKEYQHRNGCREDGEVTACGYTWRKLLGLA